MRTAMWKRCTSVGLPDGLSCIWLRAVVTGAVMAGLALSVGQAYALECGDTIRTDTVLDRDLGPCDGTGLRIGADHITLDLNGRRIVGPGLAGRGPVGIDVERRHGVVIKNGVITGFHVGIILDDTHDSRIGDDVVSNPTTLRVEGNRAGIWIRFGSSKNEVMHVVVQDNSDLGGIWVSGAGDDFNRLISNLVVRNGSFGISFSSNRRGGVNRGLVLSNTVSDNSGPGIVVSRGTVTVWSNTVERNGDAGIRLEGAEQASVAGNRVGDNGSHGIHLQAAEAFDIPRREAHHNQIIANEVEGNHGHGIFLDGAEHNRLFENIVVGNEGAGFQLGAAVRNVLLRNESRENLVGMVLVGDRQVDKETGQAFFTNRSNNVRFNLVERNRTRGITLQGSSRNSIVNNQVLTHEQWEGIVLVDGNEHALIEANELLGNGTGIAVLLSAEQTSLVSNTVRESAGVGITVQPRAQETLLEANTASENGFHGIEVFSPRSTLTGNTANFNGVPGVTALGIFAVPGVTDGGGNRATGNTDPLQCVGVVCS